MSEELKLIKPLRQKLIGEYGDCTRTCLAMLLGDDSPDGIPNLNHPDVRAWHDLPRDTSDQPTYFNIWLLTHRKVMMSSVLMRTLESERIGKYEFDPTIYLQFIGRDGIPFRLSVGTEYGGHAVVIDPRAHDGDLVLYDPNPERKDLYGNQAVSRAFKDGVYTCSLTFWIGHIIHPAPHMVKPLRDKLKSNMQRMYGDKND